jgi:hypothetical protein
MLDRDFYSTASDDTYSFQVDAQGHTTSMVRHAEGKDIPIKRIE